MGSDCKGPLETKQMSLDCRALPSMAGMAIAIDLNMCPGVGVGTSSKAEGGGRQRQGHDWNLISTQSSGLSAAPCLVVSFFKGFHIYSV